MSEGFSQSTLQEAHLLFPEIAELRVSGETRSLFLATGATTGGAFCIVDETAPAGETVPLHRHSGDLEAIYLVEGSLEIYLNDGPVRTASEGAFAFIPAGAVHGFRVASDRARYLLVTTPHHGAFYRAISKPKEDVTAAIPVDETTIMNACRAYDIEFIGPFPDLDT